MVKTKHVRYFVSKAEMKVCNLMINRKHFFDEPVKNDPKTCDSIWKITNDQGDYYTIVFH